MANTCTELELLLSRQHNSFIIYVARKEAYVACEEPSMTLKYKELCEDAYNDYRAACYDVEDYHY